MKGSWRSWLVDSAAVAAAWAGALVTENVAVGLLFPDQFSGAWELALSRRVVVPLAALALAPAALVVAGAWAAARWAGAGAGAARRALAVVGGLGAVAVAVGVTQGRHFANLGLRAAFVVFLAAAGGALGAWGAPRVAGLRERPLGLAALGLTAAISAWLGDEFVLPRLYPAFHAALGVLTLLGVSALGLALRDDRRRPGPWSAGAAALVAPLLAFGAISGARGWTAIERAANLRRVLVERAPLLGRAVAAAAQWSTSQDGEGAAAATPSAATAPTETARSLDWTGHDLVLLTVDALRADHVSSYGYVRSTTPSIDALAREGAAFESAYCATPHTSYSVTSTMTGKYLRPLLALGLGEDSETWAQDLRRYGWRTAAFYPPAVFFIDQPRFATFESEHLGFEYAKVEFAGPSLREAQLAEYLDGAPADRPLFLWVHFFEPHEPYVAHPEHPFSGGPSADVDAYDSEVAMADEGIGRVVRLLRARRPDPVVIVTADHGEEFGEHGGRYHGTTVYEEQVRVPLVVVGPGVREGARLASVVQTIDLLPTVLSALGIPRPARVRGRDLGALLGGRASSSDPGFAFAETDDYALVASGPDRLICARRAAACELFRPGDDPDERRDRGPADPERLAALRAALRATEKDHGRYETAGIAPEYPEALRRGLQGDADAALDVAALLDDANVAVRRKAAEVCFLLHASVASSAIRRALDRDEDADVRGWAALALARIGEPAPPLATTLLADPRREWRRAAALALGGAGDARACKQLEAEWAEASPEGPGLDAGPADGGEGEAPQLSMDLASARDLLVATTKARCRGAVPALVRALGDVRARPFVADALGGLGDERARAPLLTLLADEPYVTTRPREAAALLALGAHEWFEGADAGPVLEVEVDWPADPERDRVAVLVSDGQAEVTARADGVEAAVRAGEGTVRLFELPAMGPRGTRNVRIEVRASTGRVVAIWRLRRPT